MRGIHARVKRGDPRPWFGVRPQVTAKPEQLSGASTTKALDFVAAFDVAALDDGAVEAVANVMSNLLKASASQFDAEDNVLELERKAAAEEVVRLALAAERVAAEEAAHLALEAELATMGAVAAEMKRVEFEAEQVRIRAEQKARDARQRVEAAEAERLRQAVEAKKRAAQLESIVNSLASSLASRSNRTAQHAFAYDPFVLSWDGSQRQFASVVPGLQVAVRLLHVSSCD
jgi:hypothetical protein